MPIANTAPRQIHEDDEDVVLKTIFLCSFFFKMRNELGQNLFSCISLLIHVNRDVTHGAGVWPGADVPMSV
jgi:hypothetical protein